MNILVASDLHLAPKTIPNYHIISSLRSMFDRTRLQRADALFWTGDLWDRALSSNDLATEENECIDWIVEHLRLCKETKTPIRMVKGTPWHDWNQCKWFIKQNELCNIGADIRYFDDVHLEMDPTLNVWIGYIPDAIRDTPEQVYDELVEKMKTLGCEKIDYILSHGFFDFQNTYGAPAYDTVKFSDIVRYGIFNGHDHGNKQHLKVWVPGSFERLTYGEEGPKGILQSRVINGNHHVSFIENTYAAWLRTCNLMDVPDAELLTHVDAALLAQCPDRDGYLGKLRLRINDKSEHKHTINRMVKHCRFKLDIEYQSEEIDVVLQIENAKFSENLVPLTPDNIEEQLLADLSVDLHIAEKILSRVKKEVKV